MYTQKEVLPMGLEYGGFSCATKIEVGCLEVKIKLVLATIGF